MRFALALLPVLVLCTSAKASEAQPPPGFHALFDGISLVGWQGLAADPPDRMDMPAADLAEAQRAADQNILEHWRIDDGVLRFDGGGVSLVTKKWFGDFELLIDWQIERGGDSGIYLRGVPQVQIWDHPMGSGGLYNNEIGISQPSFVADRPVGQWNTFRIVVIGDRVSVRLNEHVVVENAALENMWDRAHPVPQRGPIELQAHGTPLAFRNIFIRGITDAEAERHLLRDERMTWWRDAKFGMFIHWGLYALPAGYWNGQPVPGIGEWIMHNAKISRAEYATLAAQFNPVNFNARQWARTARNAGMKYLVITSKHHDGFCLFDTQQTGYDVMDATPFQRDIIRELSEACRAEGVRFGVYYSIMDWHDPQAVGIAFPHYAQRMNNQVRELLTGIDHLDVMWFDGEWIEEWTADQGRELYGLCRTLKPSVIVNNRAGKGRHGMSNARTNAGDFGTPEQEIPRSGSGAIPGYDWESCMTMNDTWGFKTDDHNWKSAPQMIRMLIDCASRGGNLLLNVGPTAEGLIPAASIERLEAIGEWLNVNGEAIYGAEPSPIGEMEWGRCTAKPGRLYLHLFQAPADLKLTLPSRASEIRSAHILGSRSERGLKVKRADDGWSLELPATCVDNDRDLPLVISCAIDQTQTKRD